MTITRKTLQNPPSCCFDILIIGNGVLGLSTAYELALENSTLTIGVIGPSDQSGGATAASGAMLGCFGEVTYSTQKSIAGRKKLEMNVQAAQLWPAWVEQINERLVGESRLDINEGTFIILNSQSGELDTKNYNAIKSALDKYEEPYSIHDIADIPGLDPLNDCRPMDSLYLPKEGSLDSAQLLKSLNLILETFPNVSLINAYIKKLVVNKGKIEYLKTECEKKIHAKQVVIAAGAYSQFLLDQIAEIKNRIPRMFYGVGCSALIEKEEINITNLVRTPNRSFACGLHILPRNKKNFYIGATNNVSLFPERMPNVGLVHFLLQCAMDQINQDLHSAKIIKIMAGNRPVTIDTFPLIGETSIPGLWLLTGNYRDGLHCAPLLAKHIAKNILGERSEIFENIFQPERLPIQIYSREEAILEATQHYMAGASEHSIALPRVGWDLMFEEMLHKKFEDLYQELDIDFTLPTDFLLMFDKDKAKHIQFFQQYNKAVKAEFS